MRIAVSGGTGFIGRAIVSRLVHDGHAVLLLTRGQSGHTPGSDGIRIHQWDARTAESLSDCLDGVDAVINLAGEPLARRRWSHDQKARIVDSRVESTRAIVDAIARCGRKPQTLVNASAIGYYGSVESEDVTESHRKGKGFLVAVTERWEHEALRAERAGVRVVLPRISLVLGEGGALSKMLLPFRMFAGGPIGTGKQWVSWVHIDDLVGSFLFTIERKELAGPVNIASPGPVTMEEFCRVMGNVMHRPSWLRVPSIALRVVLGEMADMLLTGQKVVPEKLIKAGYSFRYPEIEGALRDVLG